MEDKNMAEAKKSKRTDCIEEGDQDKSGTGTCTSTKALTRKEGGTNRCIHLSLRHEYRRID